MRTGHRLPAAVLCASFSLLFGSIGRAQEMPEVAPPAAPILADRVFQNLFQSTTRVNPAPSLALSTAVAPDAPRAETSASRSTPSRHAFSTLYVGLIATQALDVHSTIRALDAGHKEANPLARWATANPITLVAFKAAATTGTMYIIERLRKKHPKRALLLLAVVDSAYAFVVAHNYSVPIPSR
jgi:hypothetical protein